MPGKFLRWLMIIFLVADIGYSFLQHLSQPLDGDLAGGVVPDHHVERILQDPFAVSAVVYDSAYANPNRFFANWTILQYFRTAPLALQTVTDPINSVYVASAVAKTLIQFLIILLLAACVTGVRNPTETKFLTAAALITPLFQTNGFVGCIGIIDPSVTYTFFYGLTLGLTLLFFAPLFFQTYWNKRPPGLITASALFLLVIYLALSGPLVAPVLLISTGLYVFARIFRFVKTQAGDRFVLSIMLFAAAVSAYSLFAGTKNTLLVTDTLDVSERYARLPLGLWHIFSNKLALPLLLLMIGINGIIIRRKYYDEQGNKLLRLATFIGIGAVGYLILLPIGGYKSYRPEIIRHDTLLPVTLAIFFVYGLSSVFLLSRIHGRWYSYVLVAVSVIFMLADAPEFGKNEGERAAIAEIAASPDDTVLVNRDCPIISWEPILVPSDSRLNGELLYYWRITDRPKLYFQPQREKP